MTNKKLCVYLDYATIPSLAYMLDFAMHYKDQETIRLFGLSRFQVPESIIQAYPEGIIQFYPVKGHDFSHLLNAFEKLLISEMPETWDIVLHLNLLHSPTMMSKLLKYILRYQSRITHLSMHLYDDGSEGVGTLTMLSYMENLDEKLKIEKEKMAVFLEQKQLTLSPLTRYTWGTLFPATYHLFNTTTIEEPSLSALQSCIQPYKKIDFSQFHRLNSEQKSLFLSFFKLDEEYLSHLRKILKNSHSFLFLGTTEYTYGKETLYHLHIDAFKHFYEKEGRFSQYGKNTLFLYKGHPNETDLNKRFLATFPFLYVLPSNIPMEVFCLLGLTPNKVGGFASTSVLSFSKEQIEDLIFVNDDNFMKSLIKLGYVQPNKCHSYILNNPNRGNNNV